VEDEVMEEQALPDERLQLVFTYCHPALALEEQVVYPIFGFVDGEPVLLEDQNRSLCNQDQIADGRARFDRAIAPHGRGPMCCKHGIASLQVDDPIALADTAAATVAATIAGRPVEGRTQQWRSFTRLRWTTTSLCARPAPPTSERCCWPELSPNGASSNGGSMSSEGSLFPRRQLVRRLGAVMGRWNWWLPRWPARLLRVSPTLPPPAADGGGEACYARRRAGGD
jgi:hypothetical protein